MLFKSENCFFRRSVELRPFLGLLGVVGIGTLPAAHALTVTPPAPWQLVNENTVYYQHYAGSGTAPVMDQDFTYFDFSKDSASAAPPILYFDITSEKSFPTPAPSVAPGGTTATPRLVAQVYTNRQNGGDRAPIPIIFAGSPSGFARCDGATCQRYDEANGFYYAAHYVAGETLRIGINLQDVCRQLYLDNSSLSAFGCTADSVSIPTVDSTTSFSLTFYVSYAPNDTDLGVTDASADSVGRSIKIQADVPQFACTASVLANAYFPGDGEIELNTSAFNGAFVHDAGTAPAAHLVVAGKKDAPPAVWSNFWAGSNDIVARFPVNSGTQVVTGFSNTTTGTDNSYQLAFSTVDAAGTIAPASGCALGPVRTVDIQSFLSKGNCFIATGAFRSVDAGPVVLLRQFRDQVLLSFSAGRAFVNWYYTWSPAKAEWLMRHPGFRFPVLQALLPLEIGAWLLLHPTVSVPIVLSLFLMTITFMITLCFGFGRRFL